MGTDDVYRVAEEVGVPLGQDVSFSHFDALFVVILGFLTSGF